MGTVPIHADELIMALENHSLEMRFYLDRQTGEVFPVFDDNDMSDEDRERIEADMDRFVCIDAIPSSEAFDVMEAFIRSLDPGQPRRRLEGAIRARHPFRTFKDALSAYPDLLKAWYAFHDREWTKLAAEWLEEQQIDATLETRSGLDPSST